MRNVLLGPTIFIFAFLTGAHFGGESWLSFRGDPAQTGTVKGELPDELKVAWTFEADDGIESTAAIAGSSAYIGSLGGSLYALNILTGELRWKFGAEDLIKSSPLVAEGNVFFGDEIGNFYAIDAETGKEKWRFQGSGEFTASPNFFQGRILVGSYDQFLYCFSAEDGSVLWKFETEGYVHGAPAVVGENVLISGCDSYLRVIRIEDGHEIGKVDLGAYVGASPAVRDGRAYVGTFENEILCIDLEELQIVWKYRNPRRHFPFYSSASVTQNLVIVGGRDKMLHSIHRGSGLAAWTFATKGRIDSSPVTVGIRVIGASTSGLLYVLDLLTGEVIWQFDSGDSFLSSPSVATGSFVISSENGLVYCFTEE